jgi:signal transduction histidine kinase/CheY-like chemotaxis protein
MLSCGMAGGEKAGPRVQARTQRAARLQLLAEVGRKTTAILSRDELLRSAVATVRDTFNYFMVNIFLVEGDEVVVAACSLPQLQKAVNGVRLKVGQKGITGWVAAHGQPLNVPDVRVDTRYSYEYSEELQTRSEVAVPITLKGVVMGVLDAQSTDVGAFTDLDIFTLQSVADQLAVAIENARLYEELQRELAVRGRGEALLRSLHAAALALEAAASPDDVLVIARRELAGIGLTASVDLLDPAGAVTDPRPVPPSGPVEKNVETVEAFRRILGGEPSVFAPGSLVAPLRFEDRVMGFLTVRSADLAEEAVPALRVFASQVAAAWRKAQLVRDLEESLRQLKVTQEQLLQSQKMEAVGRLAGGVAHDFNNLLTAILGYAELVLGDVGDDHPARPGVGEILKATHRAADLTRQLLAFSRKQVLQPRILDLNVLIEDMHGMLHRLLGEDVKLERACGADPMLVRADATQLQQVIVNLAVNARDAMPAGGTLTIATARAAAGPGGTPVEPLPPGEYCVLSVRDTGTGMDETTRGRLYEPFFTTKPKGKGTGLGLSMVYGIVKQSNGYISCRSEPQRGTTFDIYLPVATGTVEPEDPPPQHMPRGGAETVLVVEDEDSVRELITRTLVSAGYTVHPARTGDDALRVLESQGASIGLLLTDLVLPGAVSGLDLARRVTAQGGPMRLLCVSGHPSQPISDAAGWLPAGSFLQKPFGPSDLLRRVRALLDGA